MFACCGATTKYHQQIDAVEVIVFKSQKSIIIYENKDLGIKKRLSM